MAKVTQYETEEGKVPFAEWFSSLEAKAAAKVTVATARMELGNFGDHKSVGGGVWEQVGGRRSLGTPHRFREGISSVLCKGRG